jgi:hypothetical protein
MTPQELEKQPNLLVSARQALAASQAGLTLVPEAQSRPFCRFPASLEPGSQDLFASIGKLRGLARLLSIKAVVDARDGRMDKAVGSLNQLVRLNESVRGEPAIISYLVRLAILSISTRSVQTVSHYHALNEGQAQELFDTLSTVDLGHGYARAIETERVMGLRGFQKFKSGMPGFLLYAEESAYLASMSGQADGASLSYRNANSRGLLDESHGIPIYARITRMLAPVYVKSNVSRYFHAADLAEAQVFLALQAYRDRAGSYPKTLAEVKRTLGWKLPLDPFSGRELVYKPQAEGFLLYSVGPDMKDDGGRVEVKRSDWPQCPGDVIWDSKR